MKRKAHPHEHEAELNIVPYLDIMVNLVMFMLMSMTGFVTFQIVNVNMPSIARGAPPDQPPPNPNEQKLNLTVLMSAKGFYVAATGGTLPPEAAGIQRGDAAAANLAIGPTIPTIGGKEFEYDFNKLHELMVKVKQSNPQVSQYSLVPDKNVKYDAIIKTMDNTRQDGEKTLYPDVAFAAITHT